MFEKFTENVRRAIFFARYECTQLGDKAIAPEHLLLGVLRVNDPLISRLISNHSSIDMMRKQIIECMAIGEKTPSTIEIPLTNELKQVFALAAEESENLSHRHIDIKHLLLGFLRAKGSLAEGILRYHGITLRVVRREMDIPIYQSRFFAFIDILGFSNLVQRTQRDEAVLKRLMDALEIVNFYGNTEEIKKAVLRTLDHAQVKYGIEHKQSYESFSKTWGLAFSDSIVLAEGNNPTGLLNLFANMSALSLRLLRIGTFVRGGIALGPVYCEGSVVFGPALIDAYELEKNLAIYPRIVIQDKVVKYINSLKNPDYPNNKCKLFVRLDFDGLYHLDILSKDATNYLLETPDSHPFEYNIDGRRKELECLRSLIVESLERQANENLNIHVKLRWFAQYFNSVISQEKELGLKGIDLDF